MLQAKDLTLMLIMLLILICQEILKVMYIELEELEDVVGQERQQLILIGINIYIFNFKYKLFNFLLINYKITLEISKCFYK